MPKYDFNKIAEQLYINHTSAWVLSCKFAVYFHNTFSFKITPGGMLPNVIYLTSEDCYGYTVFL